MKPSEDVAWFLGRPILGGSGALATRLRSYGTDRIPRSGGVVLAFNHFSWIDIPCVGWVCKRNLYYLAKVEAHVAPGLGPLIRSFGTLSVRRGESDREAVRQMREVVRDGNALGVFVEGTRRRNGLPGHAQPGAAMVALQEDVPVVCGAIHGSQRWKVGNFAPVSIAWGEPMRFEGLPRGGKGYREASAQIEAELHRLWVWLRDLHEAGRPRHAVPPARASTTKSTRSASPTASRACCAIARVSGAGSAMSTPPVSTSTKRLPVHSQTSSFRSRVTPGLSCTTAARVSVSRLTSVDLPTLGKPMIATAPRSGGGGGAGSAPASMSSRSVTAEA